MSDDFPDNKGREQRATGPDGVSVDRRQVLLHLRDVKHTEICQAVPIKLSSKGISKVEQSEGVLQQPCIRLEALFWKSDNTEF